MCYVVVWGCCVIASVVLRMVSLLLSLRFALGVDIVVAIYNDIDIGLALGVAHCYCYICVCMWLSML